jgi:hypothetical protein
MRRNWLAVVLCVSCTPSTSAERPGDLGAGPAPPDLAPVGPTVTAVARPPDTAVSAVIDVYAGSADWVFMRYGDETGQADLTTPTVGLAGYPTAVPLFGLAPASRTRVVVTVGTNDGLTATAPDLYVDTPPLPSRFPTLTVTTNDDPTRGDQILLSLLALDGSAFSAAALIDRAGRLLWYRLGGQPSPLGLDFQRWPNGDFTFYQSSWFGFEELDFTGTATRRWTVTAPLGIDGHDMEILPIGHALALQRGSHTDDTRPYLPTGRPDAAVADVTVVELDGEGGSVTRWESWPAITLDETTPDIDLTAPLIDAIHPNSLQALPGGDLLVSLRHTETVLRVDGTSGQIRWRVGGRKSDFQFVDDPLGRFSHQHFARLLANGNLLLFDNGDLRNPQVSRAVEYRIDEATQTATHAWEYRHVPDIYAAAGGSAQRLADDDTLIAWGTAGVATEVDPLGVANWELHADGYMIYRALSAPPPSDQ